MTCHCIVPVASCTLFGRDRMLKYYGLYVIMHFGDKSIAMYIKHFVQILAMPLLFCFSYQIASTNGILLNGCNGFPRSGATHGRLERAVSVTFNDNIKMDIITSKSTITAENPELLHSPQSPGGKMRRASALSAGSIDAVKLKSYRLIVTFGICFIIALFSLPIIFYYTESSSKASGTNSCGSGTNFSEVCICCVCM